MALSARSRRGTSPSFWRNHNAMQTMMIAACMPSLRPAPRLVTTVCKPVVPISLRHPDPALKVFIAQA